MSAICLNRCSVGSGLVGWSGCCNLGGDRGRYGLDFGTLWDAAGRCAGQGVAAGLKTCVGVQVAASSQGDWI